MGPEAVEEPVDASKERPESSGTEDKFTNTNTFPVFTSVLSDIRIVVVDSEPSNESSAMPTVAPDVVAFIPTPAMEESATRSPILISPPSVETLTGTRPASATGASLPASYEPESMGPPKRACVPSIYSAGRVETIPRIVEVPLAFTTAYCVVVVGDAAYARFSETATISPALTVSPDVYDSAMSTHATSPAPSEAHALVLISPTTWSSSWGAAVPIPTQPFESIARRGMELVA